MGERYAWPSIYGCFQLLDLLGIGVDHVDNVGSEVIAVHAVALGILTEHTDEDELVRDLADLCERTNQLIANPSTVVAVTPIAATAVNEEKSATNSTWGYIMWTPGRDAPGARSVLQVV